MSSQVIRRLQLTVLCGLALLTSPGLAQRASAPRDDAAIDRPRPQRQGGARGDSQALPEDVQRLNRLSVILGRPGADRITLSILSAAAAEVQVEYGSALEGPVRTTPLMTLEGGVPREVDLTALRPHSAQVYRLRWRLSGHTDFQTEELQQFQTQRLPGQAFTFALQGDSHPERGHQFDARLYAQTLRAVHAKAPDFYLTLGDDFSVDTLRTVNQGTVAGRYLLQRPFLALVGQSAPLFLVNGNHEQASNANLDGTADNVAVWAQNARNRLFPQPAPDSFYSGNGDPVQHIGLLRNYFAWTWGDALFVVIDPYWHSDQAVDNSMGTRDKKGGRDLWNNTLGDVQYRWLRTTLENSQARFKFVFAHHVLGTGRGGVGMASQAEWGGRDRQGRDQFRERRPGWPEPIHRLMVRTGVTIFFQGHDHVFARETLDGVTYQTVPEPADPNYALYFAEAYSGAEVLPNSGHLFVSVTSDKVRVDYHRSWLPKDIAGAPGESLAPAFSYELPPNRK